MSSAAEPSVCSSQAVSAARPDAFISTLVSTASRLRPVSLRGRERHDDDMLMKYMSAAPKDP